MKRIGFWCSSKEPHLPLPKVGTPFKGQEEFLKRLSVIEENKAECTRYRGFSVCRICGCSNGISEYSFGNFVWPSGYSHYVREHNVMPELDFFDFIMSDIQTAVHKVFNHITDGPSSSFSPETLKNILKEKNIEGELVEQIMKTINAQKMVSYSEGYSDGRSSSKH